MFCNCNKCCYEKALLGQDQFDCLRDKWSCIAACGPEIIKDTCFDDACCCCTCEKKMCKGRFGLAYLYQTPKNPCCQPCGWQVEFEDTPSNLDCRMDQLANWANCPPCSKACQEVSNNCCCMTALRDYLCPPRECCGPSPCCRPRTPKCCPPRVCRPKRCCQQKQMCGDTFCCHEKPYDSCQYPIICPKINPELKQDVGCECNLRREDNDKSKHHMKDKDASDKRGSKNRDSKNKEFDNLTALEKIRKAHQIRDEVIHHPHEHVENIEEPVPAENHTQRKSN